MTYSEATHELDNALHFTERQGILPAEKNIAKRAKDMLFNAPATWPIILQEEGGLQDVVFPYLVLVGGVPMLITAVISTTFFGFLGAMMTGSVSSFGLPAVLFWAVVHFAGSILGLLVLAKIVELVAFSMGFRKSWVLSTRAIVYGSTPAYLAAAVGWIPLLGWSIQGIAFIWSLVLTIQGLKVLLAKPVPSPEAPSLAPVQSEPVLAEVRP